MKSVLSSISVAKKLATWFALVVSFFAPLTYVSISQAVTGAVSVSGSGPNDAPASTGSEVVVIDRSLPDLQVLLAGLRPGVHVEYFTEGKDIVSSLSSIIKTHQPVKTLHIVTHGAPGVISAVGDVLTQQSFEVKAPEVRSWQKFLQADAEILLYGCETGKGASGDSLIKTLAELTSAKVAASTNRTGYKHLGGDWQLERQTAQMMSTICFTKTIENYSFTLANVYVHDGGSYASSVASYYNTLSGHSATYASDGSTTIPDLSAYSMAFICLPSRALNATELNNLTALRNRGGRIVLIGEHSGFATQNTNVTNIVIALGGHLSIQSLMLDSGPTYDYLPNTNFNTASPLFQGVSLLNTGGAASAVNIGGDATVLNKSISDPTKIVMAQERLGVGDFVAWADVNFWAKISDPAYGTGRFFKNLLENAAGNIVSILVAQLSTTPAYSVSGNSAWSGGTITSDNGHAITQRGICYSTTNSEPTTYDSKVTDSAGGTGSFAGQMTGLSLNTTYYVRAYAVSDLGTAYGNTISFTTPSIAGTAPTAVADSISCPRSGTITGNVKSNDIAGSNGLGNAVMVVSPSYISGGFTLNSDGSFSYTNNGNAGVSDFFTYYLTDGTFTSGTVGVSISIYTPTTPPTGGNSTITTLSDGTYGFKTSDFPFSSSSSTFNGITVAALPSKGILKYNGLTISPGATCNDVTRLTYDQNGEAGINPLTTFTFKVLDMTGQPSSSAYTMTINSGLIPPTYAVSTSPGANGTLSCTPTTVDNGATSSCTATADTGYYVSDISGCGISYTNTSTSINSHTVSTTAYNTDCTVSVTFSINQYNVSAVPSANGTITGGASGATVSRTTNYGATQTFTYNANTGYHLTQIDNGCGGSVQNFIYSNGDAGTVNASYTTAGVTGNCTTTATTAINVYSITPSVAVVP
ncbi:MAG: DUF4347 domain-containing protein [Rhodoferax sp.]|uniref:DUF4347 domain-containing protein n=1 Tax=Rhodoferax sp. TaxID=50421 RepID=UPI00261C09DC|nr:DUF4347 domain-containing protein [Rhodoferax sp.]MDD2365951.1 DUF4347 domain-containing protein [Desulfuromonadaceae bacterium]MDD2883172.1 DUF4347 domain-containing protein [Rhodoferax sp.]